MDRMDREELEQELHYLFNPERDDDAYPGEFSHPRIDKVHKLDASYLNELQKKFDWEGSSRHSDSRISASKDTTLDSLIRNVGVPEGLFESGLKLYADSLIAYHGSKEPKGDIRYYPPAIMTFWSGFETYVRFSSELLLITVKGIPALVADYLQEKQKYLDKRGEEKIRDHRHPVLERYALLLKFGYNYQVIRGDQYWQRLEMAKNLRDYYTHLDMHEPRAISSQEVLEFMEAVLLALVSPSCELKRTLMLGQYRLYGKWARLYELKNEYMEQPFLLDWHLGPPYYIHCNFEKVDNSRFPNIEEKNALRRKG